MVNKNVCGRGICFPSVFTNLTYCVDVLERNLIVNTIQWDLRDDKNTRASEPKGLHLEALVKVINECGIPFAVWEKPNNNGKKTSTHEWRSLVGLEKKQLLHRLPEQFYEVVQPGTCDTVKRIWQVLYHN